MNGKNVHCANCGEQIFRSYARIRRSTTKKFFCSRDCKHTYADEGFSIVHCGQCGKEFSKRNSAIRRSISGFVFCGQECYRKYRLLAVVDGTGRRSRLELGIEEMIRQEFPKRNVIFNDRNVLGGVELDIFLPDEMTAIELNGYWHASNEISERDMKKSELCAERGIRLVQIDTSNIGQTDYAKFVRCYYDKIRPCFMESVPVE